MSLLKNGVRRAALTTTLLCSLIGLAAIAAPGSALAACASTTGSGSTLQANAQVNVWIPGWSKTPGACSSKVLTLKYEKTSSGQALEEFAETLSKLEPTKSGNGASLDGYVDTDDAPTTVEQAKANAAAGGGVQKQLTIPTTQAPVAVLFHLPSGCTVKGQVNVPNSVLSELWLGEFATWEAFLKAVGATFSGTCSSAITLEARAEGSGTSFVFKSYLAQINSTAWSTFANDSTNWPAKSNPNKTGNTGGKVLAENVFKTAGTVGYAALSDAQAVQFTGEGTSIFWAHIQNGEKKPSGTKTYADPSVKPLTKVGAGNCPHLNTVTTPSKYEGSWAGTLVSDPKLFNDDTEDTQLYSICGLTYDLAWVKYTLVGKLAIPADYGGTEGSAEEIGMTVKSYMQYVVGAGQTALNAAENGYARLPEKVEKLAKEAAEHVNS